MVRMINAMFGNEMYVSEDKVDEYLKKGHKLAAESAPAESKKAPEKKPNRKKKENKK